MGSSVRCIVIVDPSANESFRGIRMVLNGSNMNYSEGKRFVDSWIAMGSSLACDCESKWNRWKNRFVECLYMNNFVFCRSNFQIYIWVSINYKYLLFVDLEIWKVGTFKKKFSFSLFESCDTLDPITTCRNLSNEPRWSFFISRTLKYTLTSTCKGWANPRDSSCGGIFFFFCFTRGVWFLREIGRKKKSFWNDGWIVKVYQRLKI